MSNCIFKWFKISTEEITYRNHVWWCSNSSTSQGETKAEARYDTLSLIRNFPDKKKWKEKIFLDHLRTLSSKNNNHSLLRWERKLLEKIYIKIAAHHTKKQHINIYFWRAHWTTSRSFADLEFLSSLFSFIKNLSLLIDSIDQQALLKRLSFSEGLTVPFNPVLVLSSDLSTFSITFKSCPELIFFHSLINFFVWRWTGDWRWHS